MKLRIPGGSERMSSSSDGSRGRERRREGGREEGRAGSVELKTYLLVVPLEVLAIASE